MNDNYPPDMDEYGAGIEEFPEEPDQPSVCDVMDYEEREALGGDKVI